MIYTLTQVYLDSDHVVEGSRPLETSYKIISEISNQGTHILT